MIYIVEDDDNIRSLSLYALNNSGFHAIGCVDGKHLFGQMELEIPELILLDVMLPGDDGITILKKLKADHRYQNVPVIMETAKGSELDKVTGLDLGADDYLVKPYGMMELISRVKAVLRRINKASEESLIHYGNLILDSDKHIVTVDGENIVLTLKEFDLLRFFLANREHVLTRDQLLQNVWGMDFVGESRTVDVHIGTLREKIKEYGKYIETVRGVGYKMVDYHEEKNI